MENISQSERAEALKSIQSTIHKSETALAKMTDEGSNTTLIKKRLKAHYIGLAMLEYDWNQTPHNYSQNDVKEALETLTNLFPSLERSYAKCRENSSQRTLLDRRIRALKMAVQVINDYTNA